MKRAAAGNEGKIGYVLVTQPTVDNRFKLTFHRETRELEVCALVAGKNSKLSASAGEAGSDSGIRARGAAFNTRPCGN
jgi:uncharacterized protein (TIGR03435 family)